MKQSWVGVGLVIVGATVLSALGACWKVSQEFRETSRDLRRDLALLSSRVGDLSEQLDAQRSDRAISLQRSLANRQAIAALTDRIQSSENNPDARVDTTDDNDEPSVTVETAAEDWMATLPSDYGQVVGELILDPATLTLEERALLKRNRARMGTILVRGHDSLGYLVARKIGDGGSALRATEDNFQEIEEFAAVLADYDWLFRVEIPEELLAKRSDRRIFDSREDAQRSLNSHDDGASDLAVVETTSGFAIVRKLSTHPEIVAQREKIYAIRKELELVSYSVNWYDL